MNKRKRNPANHLLSFVLKAKSISASSAAEGWSCLLGSSSDDHITILRGIADINQLIRDATDAITASAFPQEIMLKPVQKVQYAIREVYLSGPWGSIINSFDEATIDGLRFCNAILESELSSVSIQDSQIDTWLSQIEDLLKDVNSSDVPEDLKVFFTEHLERLRRALHQYWIFGISGIEFELERSIGAGFIKRNEIRSCDNQTIVKKIFCFFGALADVITASEGVRSIADIAFKLLQGS